MQAISRRAMVGAGLLLSARPALSAARVVGQAQPPAPSLQPPGRLRDGDADLLLKMLADAPTHGLPSETFSPDGVRVQLRSDPDGGREALRRLAIAYAEAQHGQRVPPSKFDPNWGMKPQPYNALLDFDFAVAHDRVKPWIAAQPPSFSRYRVLRDALVTYEGLAGGRAWPSVPAGPDLAPGATGPRVAAVRARLAFEEDGLTRGKGAGVLDPRLVAAVKRFQLRHGIAPTGTVGAATVRAMNVTPAERAQQIRMNMERWRWAPRDRAPDRLEVNIAAAELDVYVGDAVVDTMLAAAGRPTDQSPILNSEISSIVFNPAWHVPKSIASKELIPKGRGYLASHGFTYVSDNPGAPLLQKPGPHNALGRIKFDFPNAYSVYLHDTPGQAAFARATRTVSHGCVRLQRPEDLAKRLLAADPAWPPERIDQVLAGEETTRVKLPAPMPVFLLYWTAFDQGSQMAFRDDVYGWDAELQGLLNA